ncbi:MAG: hypothetical protein ACFFB5_05680 [Promethearchaeota archaeon]
MKNSTHYLFSVGLLNLYALYLISDPLLAWFCLGLSFPLSGISFIPNFLDSYTAASFQYEGVQFKHRAAIQYRHPLTHSPWTLGYFVPGFYIAEKTSEPVFIIIVSALFLGWCSHLFLDALNPEGIPLGKTPVYTPHPVKHYSWRQPTKARTFRLARIPFNHFKANLVLSRIGLLFLALNVADLVLNHLNIISEVMSF